MRGCLQTGSLVRGDLYRGGLQRGGLYRVYREGWSILRGCVQGQVDYKEGWSNRFWDGL